MDIVLAPKTAGKIGEIRPPRPKYVKRTVRMEAEVSDKYDELSITQNTSLDTLFRKALNKYIYWDVFAEKIGLVQISPDLWKTLMGRLTDDEARQLGRRSGGDASIEFIRSYFHKFDLETVIQSFKTIGDGFMHAFNFAEFGDEAQRTVILYHKAGPRVSAYYAEVLKALCSHFSADVKVEESEDQINATIRTPKTEQVRGNGPRVKGNR